MSRGEGVEVVGVKREQRVLEGVKMESASVIMFTSDCNL